MHMLITTNVLSTIL